MEQQQGIQLDLFGAVSRAEWIRHGDDGDGGTGAIASVEQQVSAALQERRTLTQPLMEAICEPANLNRAFKRVKANRGAPGVDGMTVEELLPWLHQHKHALLEALLAGS